jgi:hypothetical protein
MADSRKYFKTVYTYEVLSEEPIPGDLGFARVVEETSEGDYSGRMLSEEETVIDGPTMAKLLMEQGSDPEFFMLDETGKDLLDE